MLRYTSPTPAPDRDTHVGVAADGTKPPKSQTPMSTTIPSMCIRWHTCCILMPLMGTGCFYPKPLWSPPVNNPPVIIFPVEESTDVPVTSDVLTLRIRVVDEEDPVTFDWLSPPGVVVTPSFWSDGSRQYSEILVNRDDVRDGMRFYCFVDDSVNTDAVQLRSWTMRLP